MRGLVICHELFLHCCGGHRRHFRRRAIIPSGIRLPPLLMIKQGQYLQSYARPRGQRWRLAQERLVCSCGRGKFAWEEEKSGKENRYSSWPEVAISLLHLVKKGERTNQSADSL